MKTLELKSISTPRRGTLTDFVVSGRSLYEEIARRGFDLVPRTFNGLVPIDLDLREKLLLRCAGDAPSGGVALYICSLCGDPGCGLISVRVSEDADCFVWSDFRYEDASGYNEMLEKLGPFRFSKTDYARTINAVKASR